MNTALLMEFVEKTIKRKALEAEAKALGVDLARIEPILREEFAADGMQRATMQGHTIYLHRSIVANVAAGCMQLVCEALPKIGGADLVKETVNAQTLAAFVREMKRDLDDLPILPPELAAVEVDDGMGGTQTIPIVQVYERMGLKVVKA